jgi:hypothetical protein
MRASLTVTAMLMLLATGGSANADDGADKRPYAGQQTRDVTTLSADDIAQIEAGASWGLAKPAELNGYPGPAHVLELAEKPKLTSEQREAVTEIFHAMKIVAIAAGKLFLVSERRVDAVFRSGKAARDQLPEAVMDAAMRRASMRLVHLEAHISTAAPLSEHQRRQYDQDAGGRHGHGAHHKRGH